VSQHRLVAIIEIVSPANKDRPQSVVDLASKIVSVLDHGVHVVAIDLLPAGSFDPNGIHGAVWQLLENEEQEFSLPKADARTIVSYAAGDPIEVFLSHPVVAAPLPEMPLFLRPDRYVCLPLEGTYEEAYRSMPAFWRQVLDGAS